MPEVVIKLVILEPVALYELKLIAMRKIWPRLRKKVAVLWLSYAVIIAVAEFLIWMALPSKLKMKDR